MPRLSPSDSAVSQGILMNKASIYGSCRKKLGEPLKWTKPKMIFVNSMSDLFHERVPDEYIVAVLKVMHWRIGTPFKS